MENLENEILILETAKRTLQVAVDGNLLKITDIGNGSILSKNDVDNLISNFRGTENLLSRCKKYNSLDDYQNYRRSQMIKLSEEKENRQKLREEEQIIFKKRLKDLLDNQPIPTTRDNLRTIMKWLNTHNWGLWQLPKMTIGYSAHSYDCDGKSAVTITLDKPIDGLKKYKYNAPAGHLKNYTNV